MTDKIEHTDAEWRQLLSPEEYRILREKGTERAFTGHYYKTKEPGIYVCAACGHELFDADTKYESGSGWPSFFAAKDDEAVATESDRSTAWSAPKPCVPAAARIWAMSSRTARPRPACAIA